MFRGHDFGCTVGGSSSGGGMMVAVAVAVASVASCCGCGPGVGGCGGGWLVAGGSVSGGCSLLLVGLHVKAG